MHSRAHKNSCFEPILKTADCRTLTYKSQNYALMISFNALPALNFGAFDAGIVIAFSCRLLQKMNRKRIV